MTPDEAVEILESLPGVKRKGTSTQPAWSVQQAGRPLAPPAHPCPCASPPGHPFGVAPRFEAHHKVEAYLDHAEPAAVRRASGSAWEMQRS